MSWGKTPEAVPPYVDLSVLPEGTELILVTDADAKLPENRSVGIRSPGWWLYRTWINEDESVQHYAELLVAMSVPVGEEEPEEPVTPEAPETPEAPVTPEAPETPEEPDGEEPEAP
jgi:hypothetical protein